MSGNNVSASIEKLAAAKSAAFNSRFRTGDSVMFLASPCARPEWDRIYSYAYPRAGRVVVQLAGREEPVDIDKVLPAPAESSHVRCPEARLAVWKLAAAFLCGFGAAIVIGLTVAPATAEPTSTVVIECLEPGEVPSVHVEGGPQA